MTTTNEFTPPTTRPAENRDPTLSDILFTKRLLFVVGKGGAGKTTASLALAYAAELLNKSVLLVELHDAEMLGQSLRQRALSETPEKIRSHIWAVQTNPRKELEEYIHDHVNVKFIANRITGSKLFDHLAAATPGLKEAMTLGKIWRFEKEKKDDGTPRFDLIIVDAPASGHGQSLLRVPQTIVDMIQIGPIAEQTKIVLNLIRDIQKTGIVLITLPEELPINEAMEFKEVAEKELKMNLLLTMVNGMRPKIFSPDEVRYIGETLEAGEIKNNLKLFSALFKAAECQIHRREIQECYFEQLKKRSNGPIVRIPYFYTNKLQKQELNEIARIFSKSIGRGDDISLINS